MKVFKPSDTHHTLYIIPRSYVSDATMVLRDELKEIETVIDLDCETVGNYLSAPFEFQFREGASYELVIYGSESRILYNTKVYATDFEDLQNYKLTQ